MEHHHHYPRSYGKYVALIVLFVLVLVFINQFKARPFPENPEPRQAIVIPDISLLPIFSKGLVEAGVTIDNIGFHSFSKDGRYFLFSAFKEGPSPQNKAYLVDLNDNVVKELIGGSPVRDTTDGRVVELVGPEGLVLYDIKKGSAITYKVGENVLSGSLSPNGNYYIVNTLEGLKLITIETASVSTLSNKQYGGAYGWFSDSKKILGFQETNENLMEAGKGRVLGIWNVYDKTFTSLGTVAIPRKDVRYIEWLVQDKIARVNTGWDDGSYDYLVNIETGAVLDVGETSGALMGGMATDGDLGIFAVVNPNFTANPQGTIQRASMYGADLKPIHSITLSGQYYRESVKIVNKDQLLYIRKGISTGGTYKITSQELVLLDLNTNAETILQVLPVSTFTALSLAPDHRTWVVSTDKTFITGKL